MCSSPPLCEKNEILKVSQNIVAVFFDCCVTVSDLPEYCLDVVVCSRLVRIERVDQGLCKRRRKEAWRPRHSKFPTSQTHQNPARVPSQDFQTRWENTSSPFDGFDEAQHLLCSAGIPTYSRTQKTSLYFLATGEGEAAPLD